eukprot:scaffold2816_cov121-Cylindrotheca_fusiformis.AAC.33
MTGVVSPSLRHSVSQCDISSWAIVMLVKFTVHYYNNHSDHQFKMQFRVAIPESVKEGQTIRIRCPDGTEASVKVPKGLKPGDSFVFELSVDQLTNPEALLETLNGQSIEPKVAKRKGFLERDIVNIHDLLLALAVGLDNQNNSFYTVRQRNLHSSAKSMEGSQDICQLSLAKTD